MLRLDYLSCALTILSTCLVSRRMWQGWVVAAANSVIICIIGFRTAQFGFVPRQSLLPGALFPRHLHVEEFFRSDSFAREIGVSYVEAVREGGSFAIRIFGQSGVTARGEGQVFGELNPGACQR